MAISYTVADTGGTTTCMYRASGPVAGIFTYNQRRIFLPFNLLATGLSVGQVESATLIFTVSVVTGGGCPAKIRSGVGADGPGAILDATNPDWKSCTNVEDTFVAGGLIDVNATGTYSFQVDPAKMDFGGVTWYRMTNNDEGQEALYVKGFTIRSTEAASNKPILRLSLFSSQVIFVQVM